MRILVLSLLALSAFAAQPAKTSAADATIEQEIRHRLGKSKIAANHFQFKVQSGVVTWTGKTDVIQHKGAATRIANASGARRVDNQIQISDAARQRARANLEKVRGREPPPPGTPLKRAEVKK